MFSTNKLNRSAGEGSGAECFVHARRGTASGSALSLWACVFFLAMLGLTASAWAGGFPEGHKGALGPRFEASGEARTRHPELRPEINSVLRWNSVAIDACGLDHTPVESGENRIFGEQYGPTRSSRAMAIVHIAMFDALNAVIGGYKSYAGLPRAQGPASLDAAVAQAAHDTLVELFPSQKEAMDALLDEDLAGIPDTGDGAKERGTMIGRQAAAAIMALRAGDGSHYAEPLYGTEYIAGNEPGAWRQDPVSQAPICLGAYWRKVRPFVMTSAEQFRIPPPPALESQEYADAFNEVRRLGGDGVTTPTERSEEQTVIGIYWAYDGTPSLCAPPRLYNQVAVAIAGQMGSDAVETARLLALVNVAMADAAIAGWESKYYYKFWRPITGIREADEGTGPTGIGDLNPETFGDPGFMPLGAPASNLQGPNFTPPFPAYPSGHAGFGGAVFQTLRRFYGTDDIAFTFVSDEFNGETLDNEGNVRPLMPRSFESLSEAEEENGRSRIFLGIHWAFDSTEGIAQGRQVADYVFDHAFMSRPRPPHR